MGIFTEEQMREGVDRLRAIAAEKKAAAAKS
jgi:hypothetical protein